MQKRNTNLLSDAVQQALDELKAIVAARYPGSGFRVYRGEEPEGIYLETTVDVEDLDEVMDLVVDPLLAIEVDRGLPVYLVTAWPQHRLERQLHAHAQAEGGASPHTASG